MIPSFLQRRSHPLRIGFAMGGVALLILIYTLAIAYIIADRTFTRPGKLGLIALMLIIALLAKGLIERLRR